MTSVMSASFTEPTEIREFGHGHLDLLNLEGSVVGRFVLEPGWCWSRDVAPIVGTDTCQQRHVGYVLAGRMHVVADDGTEGEAGAGEVFQIEPGHDAWTVGDETVMLLDFAGAGTYALEPGVPEAREAEAPPTRSAANG